MNSLDAEVRTNGYFHAAALKVLKTYISNPLVVSHLKLKKELFEQKEIHIKGKLGHRSIHQ